MLFDGYRAHTRDDAEVVIIDGGGYNTSVNVFNETDLYFCEWVE